MKAILRRLAGVGRKPAPSARIPVGERVYAVGDVHGELGLLDRLLERIDSDAATRGEAGTVLVFLGDLVDRGPDTAGVISRLIALACEREVRLLLGNHEEAMLAAYDGKEGAMRFFCRFGGRETLASYGLSAAEYEAASYAELVERMRALIPAAHIAFLRGFEDVVEIGDYAFVHAGIRPGVALTEQKPSDLRWIREPFLDSTAAHAKMIVHGHTISDAVVFATNRIGVDTGAYATGRLSAIGLEGADRWTIEAQRD